MSQALIYGLVSGKRLMDLSPIGEINGQPLYPLHGAEDDDAGSGGEDDADDSEEDEDDSDESDKDDDDSDKGKSRKRQATNKNTAYAAMRRELNALKREKNAADKAAREAALKEKPEIERLTAEKEDLAKERERLLTQHSEAVIKLEIIEKSLKKYDWADIEDVLNDKKVRTAIEIDDDGEISGVEEALKDLAKRKPHFLASKSDKDTGDKGKTNGKAATGKTGENVGNGSTGDRSSDRDRLIKSYPTLGHMVEN